MNGVGNPFAMGWYYSCSEVEKNHENNSIGIGRII